MNDMTETILIIAIAVGLSTAIYKFLPHRKRGTKKPLIAFFPKYFESYSCDTDEIKSTLLALEFKEVSPNIYSRGKVYGDFSAKAIKLTVSIQPKEKLVKVGASFFGILFDTGDIWQLTSEIAGAEALTNACS